MFLIFTLTLVNTYLKVYVNLPLEASHDQSPLSYVWWQLVLCKRRFKLFNMSRDVTKARD